MMIHQKMNSLYPIQPVDHFSFFKEWANELRLFAMGAAVGGLFGAILWLGTLLG